MKIMSDTLNEFGRTLFSLLGAWAITGWLILLGAWLAK